MSPGLNVRKPKIDVVPIIDTMFLLLMYFFYVVLNVTFEKGIPVNLPQVQETHSLDTSRDYCIVTVTGAGDVFLNKNRVTMNELSSLLKTLKQEPDRKNSVVCIRGEAATKHSDIVRVLEAITKAGAGNVFFEAVEAEKGKNEGGVGS